jgi:hypothetical protein
MTKEQKESESVVIEVEQSRSIKEVIDALALEFPRMSLRFVQELCKEEDFEAHKVQLFAQEPDSAEEYASMIESLFNHADVRGDERLKLLLADIFLSLLWIVNIAVVYDFVKDSPEMRRETIIEAWN